MQRRDVMESELENWSFEHHSQAMAQRWEEAPSPSRLVRVSWLAKIGYCAILTDRKITRCGYVTSSGSARSVKLHYCRDCIVYSGSSHFSLKNSQRRAYGACDSFDLTETPCTSCARAACCLEQLSPIFNFTSKCESTYYFKSKVLCKSSRIETIYREKGISTNTVLILLAILQ